MKLWHKYPIHFGVALFIGLQQIAYGQVSGTKLIRPLDLEVVDKNSPTFEIRVYSPQAQQVQLQIKNSSGTVVYQEAKQLQAGSSNRFTIVRPAQMSPSSKHANHFIVNVGPNAPPSRIGFGYLFVVAGQSNAANAECNSCPKINPNPNDPYDAKNPIIPNVVTPKVVVLADSANPTPPITDPGSSTALDGRLAAGNLTFKGLQGVAPLANGVNANVLYRIGKDIYDAIGVPVGFIVLGVGGTTISEWEDATNGLHKRFHYATPFKPTAVLWHQGESETEPLSRHPAQPGISATDYQAKLSNLISAAMHNGTGGYSILAPWFISRASKYWDQSAGAYVRSDIIQAQNNLITAQGKSFSLYSGPNTDTLPHKVHFDFQDEYYSYARAWYESLRLSGAFTGNFALPQRNDPVKVNQLVKRGASTNGNGTYFFARVSGSNSLNPATNESLYTQFQRTRIGTNGLPLPESLEATASMPYTEESMYFYLADRFDSGSYNLPLYQCKATGQPNVFLSPVPGCETSPANRSINPVYSEHRATSLLGYAASTPQAGTMPLYRCHRIIGGAHLAHIASLFPGIECVPANGFYDPPEFIGHVRTSPLN